MAGNTARVAGNLSRMASYAATYYDYSNRKADYETTYYNTSNCKAGETTFGLLRFRVLGFRA